LSGKGEYLVGLQEGPGIDEAFCVGIVLAGRGGEFICTDPVLLLLQLLEFVGLAG
jgi:hypothetical protein